MEERNPLSILLVEDDEAARVILSRVLHIKFPQITLYCADNGKTGLECFKEHTPGIVITDIVMPEMDGIRMAEEIRSIDVTVRLIVLTAFSDKSILEKFKAIGFDSCRCVLQPIDYNKLFEAIEQCLNCS